jgi:hypothetical protein
VYLTNATVSDPWAVVDGYDDRSWIENGLFRNSKQFWRLTRWFPPNTRHRPRKAKRRAYASALDSSGSSS